MSSGQCRRIRTVAALRIDQPFNRAGQLGQMVVRLSPRLFGLYKHAAHRIQLRAHMFGKRLHHRAILAARTILAAGKPKAGNSGQPFFKLAVKTVLSVTGEQFQKANDQ